MPSHLPLARHPASFGTIIKLQQRGLKELARHVWAEGIDLPPQGICGDVRALGLQE